MPQSRWFKVRFAALLISGAWLSVGCVAANAPTEQSASPAGAPPATVLQIMNVLTSPASEVVFSSVQTVAIASLLRPALRPSPTWCACS